MTGSRAGSGRRADVPHGDQAVPDRHLWRIRDFRWWFGSRTVSAVGSEAAGVALYLLVYDQTRSAVLIGVLAALRTAPYLLFGLVAGAVADRWRRKRLMICADALAAAAIAIVPLSYAAGALDIPLILAVAFSVWLAFVWFDAAAWGSLVRVVTRDRLPEANSLVWSAGIVAAIAMPALAGLVSGVSHPSVVLAGSAVCYLASLGFISGIRTRLDPPTAAGGGTPAQGVRADITEGIAFLWRVREIRVLTLSALCLTLSGGAVLGLLVVHADEMLGVRSDARIGMLFTSGAVGALVAARLLPRVTRRYGAGRMAGVALTALVPATAVLALSAGFALGLLAWLVWQAAYSFAVINGITIRQQLTPDDLQGRVNTVGRMIALAGTPAGGLLGGLVAGAIGAQAMYLLAAVPALVGAVMVWASPVPRLRLA